MSAVAFHFRTHESIGDGLDRIVREELKRAIGCLREGLSSNEVHRARKSLKKVRAILLMLGDVIGSDAGTLRALQRANRRLSRLRDADAMVEMAHRLAGASRGQEAAAWSRIEAALRRNQARVFADAKRRHVRARVTATLKKTRRSVDEWHWSRVHFATFLDRVRGVDKRARQAMRRASTTGGDDDFHAWRKRAKTLWYAARLLERRVPALSSQIGGLKRLDTLLGDDHNLVLFARCFAGGRVRRLAVGAERVAALVKQRRRRLRASALRVGARLFRERPRHLERRLTRLWKARRRRPDRAAVVRMRRPRPGTHPV